MDSCPCPGTAQIPTSRDCVMTQGLRTKLLPVLSVYSLESSSRFLPALDPVQTSVLSGSYSWLCCSLILGNRAQKMGDLARIPAGKTEAPFLSWASLVVPPRCQQKSSPILAVLARSSGSRLPAHAAASRQDCSPLTQERQHCCPKSWGQSETPIKPAPLRKNQ